MSGCGLFSWALRIGALAAVLAFAGPAMAHDHAHHADAPAVATTTDPGLAASGHDIHCPRHEHRESRRSADSCCHGGSASCTPLPPPTVTAPAAPVTLSYGLPPSQDSHTLAGVPPPAKPPRT